MEIMTLKKFMRLSLEEFVQYMTDATEKAFGFLDEALKTDWLDTRSDVTSWAIRTVQEAKVEEGLMDTACTIAHRLAKTKKLSTNEIGDILAESAKIIDNYEKYEYSRFWMGRIILRLSENEAGMDHGLYQMAVDVVRQFENNSDVGEIAKEETKKLSLNFGE